MLSPEPGNRTEFRRTGFVWHRLAGRALLFSVTQIAPYHAAEIGWDQNHAPSSGAFIAPIVQVCATFIRRVMR